jgi:hypothetical protein
MRAVAAVGIHALSLGGAFAQQPSFTAHVASATTLEDALAAYAHLKTLLPSIKDPFVHQVDLGAQGVSFRVRVGGLMTKLQAEALCATILAVGHPSCSAEDAHALARTQPGYYGDLLLKFLSDGRNMEVAQPIRICRQSRPGNGKCRRYGHGRGVHSASLLEHHWIAVRGKISLGGRDPRSLLQDQAQKLGRYACRIL